MTITYQYRVANTTLGGFAKLLMMWKGSVYKLVYKEMIIFASLYAAISLTYRLALTEGQRLTFENIVLHCNNYTSLIPISFVLGFYVTMVVGRWWQQFRNVPWPDRTLYLTCCYLDGTEERAKIIRRTVARYMMFGLILICRSISVAVMKRFPTLDHIVEAGFITNEEAIMYEKVECKYNKFWVPLMWANAVLSNAKKEGHIKTDWGLRMIIEALADFRDKCSLCFVYDWITVPLVYTQLNIKRWVILTFMLAQVVTLAVHSFFISCLLGRQFLDPSKNYKNYEYDMYVPVFTLLEFFFYMGWLKVAEQLINPFGEDDDDYDINWLIDRHTAVAMTLVDQMCGFHPPLVKDAHFDEIVTELPYTEASLHTKKPIFLGSTYNLAAPNLHDQRIVHPDEMVDFNDNHQSFAGQFGSSFAGSLLSLITGRQSHTPNQDQLSIPSERYSVHLNHNMDHLHTVNGQARSGRFNSVSTGSKPQRKISFEISDVRRGSAWSSDTRLNKYDTEWTGRSRSNTTGNERDEPEVNKTERKRKRSFPLSFLLRLTSDSKKQSSGSLGSTKTIKNKEPEVNDTDNTPEYVPLRRATSPDNDVKKKRFENSSDRRRKRSAPLSLVKHDHGDSLHESNSQPLLSSGEGPARGKPSRFTIEQVPDDTSFDDESTSIHHRNAQKLKDAFVSRAPMLSAIEEGGTVTSLSQVLPDSDIQDDAAVSSIIHEEEESDCDVPSEVKVEIMEPDDTNKTSKMQIPSIVVEQW